MENMGDLMDMIRPGDYSQNSHSQNRSKGRLFLSSNLGRSPKVPEVSVERETMPIPSISVRFGTSSSGIYQGTKANSELFSKDRHETHDIFGRSDIDKFRPERVNEGSQYGSVGFGEPMIPDKLGEISYNADLTHRVLGVPDRFKTDDGITARGENGQYNFGVLGGPNQRSDNGERASQLDMETDFLHASDSTSSPTLQTSSNAKCEGPSRGQELRESTSPEREKSRGDKMVDPIAKIIEWEVPKNEETGNSDNKRCLEQGVGSMVGSGEDRGFLDLRGRKMA